jgi:hypothetical protein
MTKLQRTILVILTTAILLAIAFNISPYLRGPQDWRWAYAIPGQPWRLLIPAVTLAAYLAIGLWAVRRIDQPKAPRRQVMAWLLVLWLFVPVIQTAVLTVNTPNVIQQLFFRTISAEGSGVYTVGSTITDLDTFLNNYPSLMPTFPVHPQRYPPGLPAAFYAARRLLENFPTFSDTIANKLRLYQCHDFNLMRLSNATIASALLQMVLPLVNGLIVFPLFGLARLVGNRRIALWTVFLYPIIPSFALWGGRWDQFYPLLTVTSCFLLAWALYRARHWAAFVGGLVLALATMLTFGIAAMLLPMGLWALLWLWLAVRDGRSPWPLLADGLLFALGLALPWLLYNMRYAAGLREIWAVSMSYHLGLARSYQVWLFYHLYDFGLFLGIPLAVLFVLAMGQGVKMWRQDGWAGLRPYLFPVTFGISLLLLDLSGTSRGEVARVWLFLTPFAVLTAVFALAHSPKNHRPPTHNLAVVAGLLSVQLLVFTAFLRVVTTGVPDPPAYTRQFTLPETAVPLSIPFGSDITLAGWSGLEETAVTTNTSIHYTLYWQANTPIHHPYTVFNHLLNANGDIIAQQDNMPQANQWPTTCWQPGEIIPDPYTIPLPPNLPAGTYRLVVGLYRLETGERRPITLPNGKTVDSLPLITLTNEQ